VAYPNVKNARIVPRCYLENFAHGGKIGVHQVVEETNNVLLIANVGTRFRYYRGQRRNGTPSDDIEWSLSQAQDVVAPILRAFDSMWPLPLADRAKVAELFGVQLLR
jgi:hypothetical protein